MITNNLRPYAEYKETGVPWLGKVPCHWRVVRIKSIIREKEARSTDGSGVLLSLTRSRGLIARSDMTEKIHSAKSLVGYKLYCPGEIVMNRMQAWSGMLGGGAIPGLVSPDYAVFQIITSDLVDYVLSRMKAPDLVSQYAIESKGIGSGFNRLYTDRLGAIFFSLPPRIEQASIAKYIHHTNHAIDRAIRAKKKLIGLLNEQKQAIIHRAVTRGIDSAIQLKDSGISWLGFIPQHWNVVRNMALFTPRVEPGARDLPILQVSLRSGITVEEFDQFGRPKILIADVTKYKLVRKGDISYNTMRMWQGAVGVAPCDGLVSPAYVVLKPRTGVCPEYYDLLFRTEFYKQEINRYSTGIVSDRNRLYWDQFKQIPNLAPPLDEQYSIISYINNETKDLIAAVERSEREIVLLREYRNSLVADVATGKLDVREAAAGLPEIEAAAEDVMNGENDDGDETGDSEEEGE